MKVRLLINCRLVCWKTFFLLTRHSSLQFFLVLALVSVACALDYNNKLSFNRLSTGGSYGSLLSGGSQYSIPIRGSSFGGGYGLRSLSSGYGSSYGGSGTIALLGKFPPVAKLGYVQSNYGQSNYAQSSGPVYAAVQVSGFAFK